MNQFFYIEKERQHKEEEKILSLCVGKRYFSFAITGGIENKPEAVGYYTNDNISKDFLDELFLKHEILNLPFSYVFVNFDYAQNVLIPASYYQNNSGFVLELIRGNAFESEIIPDLIDAWQIYNVYAVPDLIYKWVTNKFQNIKCKHFFSSLLGYCLSSEGIKNENDGCILIDFKTEEFSVIVLREKNILLSQTYDYSIAADVVYLLLKICAHYSFLQNRVRVLLSGLVEPHSALFNEINQFFLNVNFRTIRDWDELIPENSDFYSHYFASLNDLVRCASLQVNLEEGK